MVDTPYSRSHDQFEDFEHLAARVQRIEARQRANEDHDPDCSLMQTLRCDCWLSVPPATTD